MKKNKIFISHRRQGGAELAALLHDTIQQKGYDVILDVDDLQSGPLKNEILNKIDSCCDFLIVLTRNSLDRCVDEKDWVRLEILYAFKNKLNIIPVLVDNFQWPDGPSEIIEPLRELHAVPYSPEHRKSSISKTLRMCHARPHSRIRFLVLKNLIFSWVAILFLAFLGLSLVSNLPNQNSPSEFAQEQEIEQTRKILKDFQGHSKELNVNKDNWTSTPLILAMIPETDLNACPFRWGLDLLNDQLISSIRQKTGLYVVTRKIINEILLQKKMQISGLSVQQKVNLLDLASIMVLTRINNDCTLTLEIVNANTSQIYGIVNQKIPFSKNQRKKMMESITAKLVQTISENKPIRGRIVTQNIESFGLNIGTYHGVQIGSNFEILGEPENIFSKPNRHPSIGKATVTKIAEFKSVITIADSNGSIEVGMLVQKSTDK